MTIESGHSVLHRVEHNSLQVIVQAGGRGSRLRHYTWNKPKCLVSIESRPLLYHLFDRFSKARFSVIGDYLFEQLSTYLAVNPPGVEVTLVRTNDKGTCAGIADALEQLDPTLPVMLVWSDLIFRSNPEFSSNPRPLVFITDAFVCRWSADESGKLSEQTSATRGVPGVFYFSSAADFPRPPRSGEFVKWFAANIADFDLLPFSDLDELGDFSRVEQSNERQGFSRFFNHVEIRNKDVVKTVVDARFSMVHEHELAWYDQAQALGFRRIPKIYSNSPLTMSRIDGIHPFQMTDLTQRETRAVLADILDALVTLHDFSETDAPRSEVESVYLSKTRERVQGVARLIPGFDRDSMTVNGRKCRNCFSPKHRHLLSTVVETVMPSRFKPIHGDPTFSNTLIDRNLRAWFIDPRGYFAKPGIFGDPLYDFAKVYYSAVGGYDGFNRRRFKLHIDDDTVEVLLDPPHTQQIARDVFKEFFPQELSKIELIHALIWLSLSGYAIDDIDSVIGSFYLGLYWLEAALQTQ